MDPHSAKENAKEAASKEGPKEIHAGDHGAAAADVHASGHGEAKVGFLKSKKKRLVIIAASLVLVLGLAGGGFFYMKKKSTHSEEHGAAHGSGHEEKNPTTHEADLSENEAIGEDENTENANRNDSEHLGGHAPGHGSSVHSGSGIFTKTWNAIESVQRKVDRLKESEESNRRLRLENANLRLQLENQQFDKRTKDAKEHSSEVQTKLAHDTGGRIGRTLAGIAYRPPVHLLPSQLYTLGVTYFKAQEFEKAAVIFTYLTGMDDQDSFKTPRDYVLTGVAWYKLQNYVIAEQYFDLALSKESEKNPLDLPFLAQARLWQALNSERLEKHSVAQEWLRQVVDHHPRSPEVGWINGKPSLKVVEKEVSEDENDSASRAPASQSSKSEHGKSDSKPDHKVGGGHAHH